MAPFREHLKALFLTIFILLFILQSYNQIGSFIAQDTGTSKTWLSTVTFQFPAISVCFGFDQEKPMVLTGSHEYDMMFTYFNWYPNAGEPLTEKDIQNWWDNVTVDPKTTLDSIKLYLNKDASNHITYQVGNEDIENEDASIVKGNYHQGKCITIKVPLKVMMSLKKPHFEHLNLQVKKPVLYDNYVAFQPKEGIDKVIKFYLHSHGSELGLNRHFWPFLPTIVHANLNELSEIILGQIIVTNEPTRYRKCNPDPSYSYEKCIFDKLSENGFSNVSALQDNSQMECSNQTFCKLPYTEKYMSKSIPYCTTMLASRCNALFFGNQILEKQVIKRNIRNLLIFM